MTKDRLAVPASHLTDVSALPGSVSVPIRQLQEASPLESVAVEPSPRDRLCTPLGSVTESVQRSPGVLECALSDASSPGEIGLVNDVIVTPPELGGVDPTTPTFEEVVGSPVPPGQPPRYRW